MKGLEKEFSEPGGNRWDNIIPKVESRPGENLNFLELKERAEIIRELAMRVAPWWEERMGNRADPLGGKQHYSRQLADFVTFIGQQKDLLDILLEDAKNQSKYVERPMIKLLDGNDIFPTVSFEGYGDHWSNPIKTPDVWSLGWRTKVEQLEGTEIHDHFDSEAGVYVYKGRVLETVYKFDKNEWIELPARLKVQKSVRELTEEEALPIGAPYIHLVEAHPEEPASFTIHGYFPALKGMNMFKLGEGELILEDSWRADEQYNPPK